MMLRRRSLELVLPRPNGSAALVFLVLLIFCAPHTARTAWRLQSASTQSADSSRPAASGPVTITGQVISDDGPLANVNVWASSAGKRTGNSRRAITDSDGKFSIDGLAEGAYTLSASVLGYVTSPPSETSESAPSYYYPGDHVLLRLVRGGVLTGKVTGQDGQPLIALTVQAIRIRDAAGRPFHYGQAASSRRTDDRGIYRLYGLPPGVYLIAAGGERNVSIYPYSTDATTYYPGSAIDTAVPVTLASGEEISGLDIQYRGEPGHSVSGRIRKSGDTASPSTISLTLLPVEGGGGVKNTAVSPYQGDRSFAFYGVPDGDYYLIAQSFGDQKGEGAKASNPIAIKVREEDISGIEMGLEPLSAISGTLSLASAPSRCGKKRTYDVTTIVVEASRENMNARGNVSQPSSFARNSAAPDANGNILLAPLFPSNYRLQARLPDPQWYLRSITGSANAGQRPGRGNPAPQAPDLALNGITLRRGVTYDNVAISVGTDGATLDGKVTSLSETPMPGKLAVFLTPFEPEHSAGALRYYEARADANGSFSFRNLAPGKYFIVAQPQSSDDSADEPTRPLAWDAKSRADLLRAAAKSKTTVSLEPCQTMTGFILDLEPSQK